MKPQTAEFLDKARRLLVEADFTLSNGFNEAAGRSAYYAAYHAAQALLFERLDRVFKTHNGVQSEFLRLTRDDPRVDGALRVFLSQAYNLKGIADYETGPGAEVPPARAAEATTNARRFVDHFASLVM